MNNQNLQENIKNVQEIILHAPKDCEIELMLSNENELKQLWDKIAELVKNVRPTMKLMLIIQSNEITKAECYRKDIKYPQFRVSIFAVIETEARKSKNIY